MVTFEGECKCGGWFGVILLLWMIDIIMNKDWNGIFLIFGVFGKSLLCYLSLYKTRFKFSPNS